MAAADLGAAEWERSKITNQDLNLLKKLGISKKPKAVCFPSEESYPTPPMGYRNTRGKELSGIQITAYFLRTRVQPLQARKNPFWNYAGDEDTDRLSTNLEVKDLDRLIRKISSLKKKDPIPSTYRVKPYSATNALPKEDASEATASAQSPPPAVSPKNKRKRNDAEDSGTSKPEEVVPSRQKAGYDPYLKTLISSDDEEEVPTADVAARTSTSHTLVASETPVEGEETSPPQQNVGGATPLSSPLVPSPKRARVETIPEPTLQSSSSSNPLLDDPTIKELLRIGAQFLGYRDYASKAEEKLAEVNERANTLAQKLEQSEEARKKAESDAVEARQEADKAKADAAGVEDLRKRLHDAETSLSDHIAAQIAREEAITKRIRTQNRRFIRPLKNLNLKIPTMILFLTPFHSLNFMGRKRCFNPPEDLGLKMRHENMKVAVESTVALVADSQQTIDWAKVGNTEQIEQTKCLPPPFGTVAIVLLAIIRSSREELKELRGQLQSVKKQSLMLMEQSRESSEREKIALQQAQAAIAEKDSAVAEAAAATSRENSMLQLLMDASLDMAETIGAFLDAATEDERVEARSSVLLRLAREHGSTFWGTPERTRQIVRFQDRALQIVPKCLEKMSKKKRNFGKYDDIVTPVAEDMMDELLRMDAEFFVKGSYAEHSTRAVNNERLTIDNILGNP
ncbi:hypothetical protein QYE76_031550 [Lolium multiflorum]|uniref:Uncharacterized protein n=1 Tax=Lolium multiflorum TaxID=4521 RepID=A0AAD8VHI9_LOLMU|nr:hypothetical protein QYE76_031550 [Lolium multiflorum]